MTGTEVQTRAGDILLDASYTRWTSAQVLRWINDGLMEIHRVRPDAFYTGASVTVVDSAPQITALTESLPCRAIFDLAILDYVLARCFGVDSEDVANAARSKEHLQLFSARL